MIQLAWLCIAFMTPEPLVVDTGTVDDFANPQSAAYQTIYFAVIEGALRDGLSGTALEIILRREDPAKYTHFIYACPLCSPTISALELYANRPHHLYSLKAAGSTFGKGIPADIAAELRSGETDRVLLAIRLLTQRWIDQYLASRNLPQQERDRWHERIEAAKQEGNRVLQHYRESGSAHLLAPAFVDDGECAVCTGAFEGASKASGLWHVLTPDEAKVHSGMGPPSGEER